MSMFEHARAPRLPVIAAVAGLLVALVLLAALQYRWVGQVGEAERARLQASAHGRAEQLAQDFDREVTRAFALLQVDEDMLGTDGGERYATRYERWASRSEHPSLVSAVYVVTAEKGAPSLRRFDKAERAFVPSEWPAELTALRARLEGMEPGAGRAERGGGPRGPFGVVEDEVPALVSPIFAAAPAPPAGSERGEGQRGEGPGGGAFERGFAERGSFGERGGFVRPRSAGFTIVQFDRGYIEKDLLPTLAGRYFASGGEFDYCVVVTTRREPRAVVYRSDPADGLHPTPDASAGLLEVRFDQLDGLLQARGFLPSRVHGPPPAARRPTGSLSSGRGGPRLLGSGSHPPHGLARAGRRPHAPSEPDDQLRDPAAPRSQRGHGRPLQPACAAPGRPARGVRGRRLARAAHAGGGGLRGGGEPGRRPRPRPRGGAGVRRDHPRRRDGAWPR
jgi:hypothetical protein